MVAGSRSLMRDYFMIFQCGGFRRSSPLVHPEPSEMKDSFVFSLVCPSNKANAHYTGTTVVSLWSKLYP